MTQLALDFGHRPAYGREDYLVAPSNETAVAWIDRWPDWPGRVLALHGPAGSGKTHLTQVWRNSSGAGPILGTDLQGRQSADMVADATAVVVEDADRLLVRQPELETPLFHLFNDLSAARGFLLLTSRQPPAKWTLRLADLRSRLAAVQTVSIGSPDDSLMEAVLFKLFLDRQLKLTPEVSRYVTRRMERSFAAAQRLVDAADRAALATRREISIPLMRQILAEDAGETSGDT